MKELFRTTSPDGANVQSFVFSSAATPIEAGKTSKEFTANYLKRVCEQTGDDIGP